MLTHFNAVPNSQRWRKNWTLSRRNKWRDQKQFESTVQPVNNEAAKKTLKNPPWHIPI